MPNQPLTYQLSYWERESFFRDIDFAVIGSGIVGLSAALRIRELAPGARVAVLERGPLPIGASTRNAGFACFGSVSELLEDMDKQGEEAVWALVERRWLGLQRLRQRLGDQRIRYESWGGFELFRPEEKELAARCAEAIPRFNRQARSITGLPETYQMANQRIGEFGFSGVTQLIWNTGEGQIHTGEMAKALQEKALDAGIAIFNGLPAEKLEELPAGVEIHTGLGWSFRAGSALIATNGFARQLLPELSVRPARNQVLITPPLPRLRFKGCFHYDRGYFYFRNIDNRILLGGGRNLDVQGETTDEFGTTPLIREALLQLLREVILPGQEATVDSWWSGILGVGSQKAPIIQKVSPHVVAAVRLGGMGVAIGTLVGEEGAEVVVGKV
ncbi:MAG: FAD-binding oxidoreductase [Lewinellaceae bacterium]|nr:FAD-binding oxidoreductase [Phaeodactylibacter sp.]MCB9036318.1 FAD-binding oxidoreductase [Lewinellaceae bacterium]